MSYRHSSFRKLRKAMKNAREQGMEWSARHEHNRFLHWTVTEAAAVTKPEGWGKPKARH